MPSVERSEIEFELETAVLVVGAGATGFTAALAARDAGADVLLLERDEAPRGSTAMSQGYICAAGTRLQKEAGIEDGPERFYQDIVTRTKGTVDPTVARTVADNAGRTVDWLIERFDVPFTLNLTWGGFFGHSVNRMHGVPTRRGEELQGALGRAAADIGVDLLTGAHVDKVFADGDGRVRGVRFLRPDGQQEFVGCKALVLGTCGFGANREMVRRFIPDFGNADNYRYFGHEGNEGEGIEWGIELGADLGSMDAFQGYGALAEPQGIVTNYDMVMGGGIVVNTAGRRFSNEVADISGQSLNVLAQQGGIGWIVFDEPRLRMVEKLPEFRELVSLGALRKGASVDGLAEAIGVPAGALDETLSDVIRMTRGETACPFGRDFSGVSPLAAPYFAVKVTGALFHTQGGLRVDRDARVLRRDGAALPNLFAGGGAAQGISGNGVSGYLPAAGLCTAVTLGRLAGEAAARLARTQAGFQRTSGVATI